MSNSPSPITIGRASSFDTGRRLLLLVLVAMFAMGVASALVILTRPQPPASDAIERLGAVREQARESAAEAGSLAFAEHVTAVEGSLPAGWSKLENHDFGSSVPFAQVSVNWYAARGQTLAQAVAEHRSFDEGAGRRTMGAVATQVAGRDAVRMEIRTANARPGELEQVYMAVEDDEVLTITTRMESRESLPQVHDVLSRLQVR